MRGVMLFVILIACSIVESQFVAGDDFDTYARTEERDAIGRILVLGGQLKAGDLGHITQINLAFRYSISGMRSSNDLATDEGCAILPEFVHLTSLTMSKQQVSDKGLEFIGGLTSLQELAILDANKNPNPEGPTYTDRRVEKLAQLRDLEVLLLQNAGLSDKSLEVISELPRLRQLNLSGSHFTDAGIQKLAKLKRLERLSLRWSNISAAGLRDLVDLPLRFLGLSQCRIDDQAMVEIGKLKQLESIWLSDGSVTDEGLKHLFGMPLRTLGLGGTKVTDDAFETISSFGELESLAIPRTSVSDASLEALIELQNLRNLSLPNQFGTEAIAELQKSNPTLEVTPTDWHTMSRQRVSVLGQGLQAFREKHGQFPATSPKNELGKPMLSWRVAILPFIGEAALYERFRFDEPWNSDHNAELLEEMPQAFVCPGESRRVQRGYTLYKALVGDGTILKQDSPTNLPEAAKGKTLILVTIPSAAVPWTAPQDHVYDEDSPMNDLFGTQRLEYFYFTDGPRMVSDSMPEDEFRKYFQIDR